MNCKEMETESKAYIDLRDYGVSIANLFKMLKNSNLCGEFIVVNIIPINIKNSMNCEGKSFTQNHKISLIKADKKKRLISYLQKYINDTQKKTKRGVKPNIEYYKKIIKILKSIKE